MTKIVLISHGDLSKGMAHSAQMIAGENSNLSYYGLYPGHHPSEIVDKIKEEAKNNKEDKYIVIADVFGGSVSNTAMELLELENVKVLSGMNLSLVIEILLSDIDLSDEELEQKISNAKDGIRLFSNNLIVNQGSEEKDFF